MRLTLLLILTFSTILILAQVPADSTIIQSVRSQPSQYDEDEFNLFLFSFAAVALCVMGVIAIIALIISLLILLLIFALIGAGIFSVSLGIGIYTKSFSSGVRTALILIFAAGGIIGGAGLSWLLNKLFTVTNNTSMLLVISGTAGLIGGAIAALGIIWLTKQIFKRFRASTGRYQ